MIFIDVKHHDNKYNISTIKQKQGTKTDTEKSWKKNREKNTR